MDNKINDILENLEPDIDITYIYNSNDIKLNDVNICSTNDLKSDLKDIKLGGKKHSCIYKLKTKNFDSFLSDKRLKDINLLNRHSFFEIFIGFLKGKLSIIGEPKSFFSKKQLFSKYFFKKLGFIFLFISLILFLDKLIVENKINSGYEKLLSIKNNSGNIDFVGKNINDAKFDFILSNILFKPFLLIPNINIRNGYYVLQGGKDLTDLLDKGLQTYLTTKQFIDNNGGIQNVKFTNLLSNLRGEFSELTGLLYLTILSYDKIGVLPDKNLNNKLEFAKNSLKEGYKFFDILNRDYDIFLDLLGHSNERKYLILFQNNDEIRATGGFIGSLATARIKEGKVIDFVKDDVYAYEWEINKVFQDKASAPEGLNKITKTFGLRDANYFIDFESSSKSINFFLNKIDKKVDGIIYINQNTILDFLKLTGGVNFPELGETITEDNFSLIISTLVEAQSFKVGTLGSPKDVLFNFANLFLSKLKEDKNYFAYLDIIFKNIKSRDLVIYSFNSEENNLLWKLGLNGKINYSDTLDFSYPVFTSIGGNKSDRYMELKFKKDIKINTDCSINTNLQIYRTHYFSKFEEQKVNELLDKHPLKDKTRKDVINIQGKGDNNSYVRVLLPKDSIVEVKEGMNINKLTNSTVVDFYITTRLLESTHFDINYKILNKDCKPYDFKLYKQPGIRDYSIEINNNSNTIKESFINGDYQFK